MEKLVMKSKGILMAIMLACFMVIICFAVSIKPVAASASTNTTIEDLSYTIHEVADNTGYTPTKNNQTSKFSNGKTQLGSISVSGDAFTMKEWNGCQAVAVTGSELCFRYQQSISEVDYGSHRWKVGNDSNDTIYGYKVGEINNGGIIVLKSFNDGLTWVKTGQSVKINGKDFTFSPSGDDIAQGVLYKFVSAAEIYYTYQSGTYKNWHGPFYYTNDPVYDNHYTNLMQETVVYVASDNPVIGLYNEKTENHKLDLPEEISEVEAEIIHKGVSLSDNGISTSSITLDFLGNTSHYVDYSHNGASFKVAKDGQILSESGQYSIRVKTVFGTVKTYTIYIIDENEVFKAYFGDNIVSQAKRIYNPSSNLPIYSTGTTYAVNAESEYLPALYGSLSYFKDEQAVSEGDCSITKWNGFHKFNGTLDRNGYYAFEFSTGDINEANGDVVCFSFLAKVEDKGEYAPTVNKSFLTSSERNINLVRRLYAVPMYSTGGGAYVFCFNDLEKAEDFSYQAELRFVEDYYETDGLYFYKSEDSSVKIPYNSKVELYDAVRKISKKNVVRTTIDHSLQYGVMSLEEAIKNVETTSITKDIYVVSSIEERNKLCSGDILINGFKFTQVANYEVNKVTARNITTGAEFEIPFETVVDEVLPSESAKYEITEYNWAGSNSYIVSYLANNTAKINILYSTNDANESIDIASNNISTIEAKNEVTFISTTDDFDSESIVVISKLGYIKIVSLKDLAGKYLDEEGTYTCVVKNRAGYFYSFNIVIAETKETIENSSISTQGIHLKSLVTNEVGEEAEKFNDNGISGNPDTLIVENIAPTGDKPSNLALIISLSISTPIIIYGAVMLVIYFKKKSRV